MYKLVGCDYFSKLVCFVLPSTVVSLVLSVSSQCAVIAYFGQFLYVEVSISGSYLSSFSTSRFKCVFL